MHTDKFIDLMLAGAVLKPMVGHKREYMLDDGKQCYRMSQSMIGVLVRQGVIKQGHKGGYFLASEGTPCGNS